MELIDSPSTVFTTSHPGLSPACGEERQIFDEQFSRSSSALHAIALRILEDAGLAAVAVERCRLRALRSPAFLGNRGAFGSWILRLLILEALVIRHPDWDPQRPDGDPSRVPSRSAAGGEIRRA